MHIQRQTFVRPLLLRDVSQRQTFVRPLLLRAASLYG